MRTPNWITFLLLGLAVGPAGCTSRQLAPNYPPPPSILTQAPSLAEVTAAVNRSAAIRQLSSNTVAVKALSMSASPRLNGTLSIERDRNFRLRASVPVVMSLGIDMGSNDERFWFEVPEPGGKTLYYAGHEAYRQQLNHAIFPVDPTWLMDALGLVFIDPATVVAGPVVRSDGKLEIRNTIQTPSGTYQRVCMIDANVGYVTDQFLYAPNGALVATSKSSNPEFFEVEQCVLPHTVELSLTPAGNPPISLKIDIGQYAVNQLLSPDPNEFTMPQTAAKAIDLTTLSMPVQGSAPAQNRVVAPVAYENSQLGPLPYRGLVQ